MNRTVYLFPGQGSQYVGMGKQFYDNFEIAKRTYEEVEDELKIPLSKICFKGRISQLNSIDIKYIAILTTSIAAYRVYEQEIGVVPQYAAGHSLGEYSALVSTGLLTLKEALNLVYYRSVFAKEELGQDKYMMMVVDGIPTTIVEDICNKYDNQVYIGCYNSMEQVVLCSTVELLMKICNDVQKYNGTSTPLYGSIPFHSPLSNGIAVRMQDIIDKIDDKRKGKWKIISNVNAEIYNSSEQMKKILGKHLYCPVRWDKVMNVIQDEKIYMAIEFGSRNILNNQIKRSVENCLTSNFNNLADINVVDSIIMGKPLQEIYEGQSKNYFDICMKIIAATKNYSITDEYDEEFYDLCNQVNELSKRYSLASAEVKVELTIEAKNIMIKIMKHKNISQNEINERLRELRTC